MLGAPQRRCYDAEVSDWRIEYYETAAGRRPVNEYLGSLHPSERARVTHDINVLEQLGIQLGAPQVKSLGQGLWELRTTGRPQHRLIYVAVRGRTLLMLHAFTKTTPKTPRREIDTARQRLVDYQQRNRP